MFSIVHGIVLLIYSVILVTGSLVVGVILLEHLDKWEIGSVTPLEALGVMSPTHLVQSEVFSTVSEIL
ncbi:hypothetical protein OGZ41_13165, partial [Lactococcus lactis]|uniref:hypothetical protein n=1 Tax=Lactococcus lactis TaxID=1358 RepID=UPI002418613F